MAVDQYAINGPALQKPDPYVMYSPGGAGIGDVGLPGPAVYHGVFWPTGNVDIGQCYWEAWIRPEEVSAAVYAWIGGIGGDHAIAVGVQPNGAGFFQIMGLYQTGASTSTQILQQTCDLFRWGEWVHVAVAKVGTDPAAYKFTFINGQLSAVNAWGALPRVSGGTAPSQGLYVFGHSHQEFRGSIAWITGFDSNLVPFALAPASCVARRPSRVPLAFVAGVAADFCGDYMVPGGMVPDRAIGQIPLKAGNDSRIFPQHPGELIFTYNQSNTMERIYPRWVNDPTCPCWITSDRAVANAYVKPRGTMPVDKAYLAYDDFSGRRSSFVDIVSALPTVGATWGGSLAPQTYNTQASVLNGTNYSYGVMCGNLIYCGGTGASYAAPLFVDAGTADVGVQVSWPAGAFSPTSDLIASVGVTMRLAGTVGTPDYTNQWTALVYNSTVIVRKTVAGVVTDRTPVAFGGAANAIRIQALGSTWTLYRGNSGVWTQIDTWSDSDAGAGTLVGPAMADSGARISEWAAYPT